MSTRPYVLDSSAIIDLHDHFHVRKVRRLLLAMCRNGQLKMPEGVRRELKRKTDRVFKTVEHLAQNCPEGIVHIRSIPNLGQELARVEQRYGEMIQVGKRRYPGFWKSSSGRKAVDGQVVSVGKGLGCTVVSDDRAVRMASFLENVPCIGWAEFARVVGLSQPTLFDG